jgi:hypothetical protein
MKCKCGSDSIIEKSDRIVAGNKSGQIKLVVKCMSCKNVFHLIFEATGTEEIKGGK